MNNNFYTFFAIIVMILSFTYFTRLSFNIDPVRKSITLMIFISSTALLIASFKDSETDTWNNGKCTVCHIGNYQYEQAVGKMYSTAYIYKCDNCEYRIESYTLHQTP